MHSEFYSFFIFVVLTKINTENHFIFFKILFSVRNFGMLMINIIIMKFIATFIYFNKYNSKFKACINNIDFSPYIFFMYPFSILNLFQDFNIINQFLVFCKICTALTVHSTTIIIFDRANQRFYKRCRIYFYHFCRMMHLTRSQFFLESSQQ